MPAFWPHVKQNKTKRKNISKGKKKKRMNCCSQSQLLFFFSRLHHLLQRKTALILWGIDFSIDKQYSSSVWFQLSLIAVTRWALQVGALSWAMPLTLYVLWKKYIIILKNNVIITKHLFNWWNKKHVKNFNVSLCLTAISTVQPQMQPHVISDFENVPVFFRQMLLYI